MRLTWLDFGSAVEGFFFFENTEMSELPEAVDSAI
jgi:hypothetical protein